MQLAHLKFGLLLDLHMSNVSYSLTKSAADSSVIPGPKLTTSDRRNALGVLYIGYAGSFCRNLSAYFVVDSVNRKHWNSWLAYLDGCKIPYRSGKWLPVVGSQDFPQF